MLLMNALAETLLAWQRMGKLYTRMELEVCARHGLTRLETDILLFLANNPAYDTAKDIVEVRMIAKSHVSASIETLLAKRLIFAVPDAQDRRRVHLSTLPAAAPIIADAQAMQRAFFERLLRALSEAECAELRRMLGIISENI